MVLLATALAASGCSWSLHKTAAPTSPHPPASRLVAPTPTPLAHPYTNTHPARVVAGFAKKYGFRTRTIKRHETIAYLANKEIDMKGEYNYNSAQIYIGANHRVAGIVCVYRELVTANLKNFMDACATGLLSGTEPANLRAVIDDFKPQRWTRQPTVRSSKVVRIEHGSMAAVLSACSYGGAPPRPEYSCVLIMRPSNEGYPRLAGL